MKIAILTSGILPVPAMKGGAVENLVDFYVGYNIEKETHDIVVYSVIDDLKYILPRKPGKYVTNYYFIEIGTIRAKFRKLWYRLTHRKGYYHYTIEYYLDRALRDISQQDFDLIILENRVGYALKVVKCSKAKIVIHLHNDFLNSESRDARKIYDLASRIITVSDYIGNRVKTIDPYSKKCITVHNGIDLSIFQKDIVHYITREHLGLDPDDFVLVYSGRLNTEKGIWELILAITSLMRHPKIKLLVIGASFYGEDEVDNPFINELKHIASNLGERIKFTGYLRYKLIPIYLRLANVAVIPSIWEEPFGLTCLEAMAMGLPIIATTQGGMPEVLHPDYALMLPADIKIVPRMKDAILHLYEHPEQCESMGKAAKEASLQFDKDRYAKEFFDALESIND
ncbi:MAG: glycosyltransferase family 4 protein [Prevotella sp.]|nr:glycosyltransferase family 4 protein [Prevotella sp.]